MLGAFTNFPKATVSFLMPVRPSVLSVCLSLWNNSAPTGRIIIQFDMLGFVCNMSRSYKFY